VVAHAAGMRAASPPPDEDAQAVLEGLCRVLSSPNRNAGERVLRDKIDTGMGYSQQNTTLDLCVNVLVRPTRISPRQSGAAGPRS
jgi:hypothetical protein